MAKLAIILTENVRPSVRGELTRWMIEPRPGVFVGKLSRRVREKLWDKTCKHKEDGGCMIIYAANNEQRFAMEMAGECRREIVDFDGITLIRIPGESVPVATALPARALIPPRRPIKHEENQPVPGNPPVPPIPRPFQDPGDLTMLPVKSTTAEVQPPITAPAIYKTAPTTPEQSPPKKVYHVRMPPTARSPGTITTPPLEAGLKVGMNGVKPCPSTSLDPIPDPLKSPAPAKSSSSPKQAVQFTPFSRKKDIPAPRDLLKTAPTLSPLFALATFPLPIDLIRGMASPPSYEKGDDYQQAGNVRARFIDIEARTLRGQVVGGAAYDTEVTLFQGKLSGTCSCPVRRNCKHCVALCLEWVRNPGAFDEINIVTQNQ